MREYRITTTNPVVGPEVEPGRLLSEERLTTDYGQAVRWFRLFHLLGSAETITAEVRDIGLWERLDVPQPWPERPTT